MNKLLAIGLCLSILLCFTACANGNTASSQDGSESSLALPEGAPEDAEVHTARDGVKTILPAQAEETSSSAAPPAPEVTPDTVWQEDQTVTYHSYTPPDKAVLDEEDCIGILSIPVIELEVKAIDPGTSDMLSVMDRGARPLRGKFRVGRAMWPSPPTMPQPTVPQHISKTCTSWKLGTNFTIQPPWGNAGMR